jgi:vacuolar protein 8
MDAELIATHVYTLREGDDASKAFAARALGNMACIKAATRVPIAEAGGIPLLVELLRDGSAEAKLFAAFALGNLAYNNDNEVLIAEAGGIPPLVDLLRDGSTKNAKRWAAVALRQLARNNDASQVAIAAALCLEALVELVRRDHVIFEGWFLFSNAYAGVPAGAKRKAAVVVAALLGGCVPDSARRRVPRVLKAVIGSYL